MAPPARKSGPCKIGGRPARGVGRASLQPAAKLFDTAISSRQDRLHYLALTSWTSAIPMEYLRNKRRKELASSNIYKPESYPNVFEDPDTRPSDLFPNNLNASRRELDAFGDEMYGKFKLGKKNREKIWLAFTSTFRILSLQS